MNERRERYERAARESAGNTWLAADLSIALAEEELARLRAELASSKAAHRSIWEKHQARGQRIFDLQGENARLRAQLADAEQKIIDMGGHHLEPDLCGGCGEPKNNGQPHGYNEGYGGCV